MQNLELCELRLLENIGHYERTLAISVVQSKAHNNIVEILCTRCHTGHHEDKYILGIKLQIT